jgi:hypothetical protein
MLGKRVSEACLRHPYPSVAIRGKVRRQGVRFIAIENLGNSFTLVRRQGRNVYQRLHALIICGGDDGARISVAGHNYWSFNSGDSSLQCGGIVA